MSYICVYSTDRNGKHAIKITVCAHHYSIWLASLSLKKTQEDQRNAIRSPIAKMAAKHPV
jgi:hypothetical protein